MEGWGEAVKCLSCPLLCMQMGPLVIVDQGFVGVMTKWGRLERVLPPGMYIYNCLSQSIYKVCMKMQAVQIPQQSAMTFDNLSVAVDAVAFVTVVDPARATFQVDDYHGAVQTLAATTLQRIIGEHFLQDIFRDRCKINAGLTKIMRCKTTGWGLQVASVEIRDITIPNSMQRAMAQIAEANREADAKVIVAEGQRRAATVFAEAAEAMKRKPLALQLQWFETLRQIAVEKNSTVFVTDSVIGPLGRLKPVPGGGGNSSGASSAPSTEGGWEPVAPQAEDAAAEA